MNEKNGDTMDRYEEWILTIGYLKIRSIVKKETRNLKAYIEIDSFKIIDFSNINF